MKKLKILLTALITAAALTAALSAETIDSIEQVEQLALLNNLDYKTAVLDLLRAENALEGVLKLDSSSVSTTASYAPSSGSSSGNSGLEDLNWQVSVNLPLVEQLSLGAAVDQDLQTTVSISLDPLSHSDAAAQSRLAYRQKAAAAEETAREVSGEAVSSYLEWASAFSDLDVKTASADVKKTLYNDERVRFDKGDSTLDDVREAFTAWSEARSALHEARIRLQTASSALYMVLNVDPGSVEIAPPANETLMKHIRKLESETSTSVLSIDGSFAVLAAETAAEGIELQLESTWLFEPQLNISGGLAIPPDSTVPSLSATASLSLSLESWNADDRKELETELEISRQQAVQAVRTEQLNLQQAASSAESAAINYEVARVELEQAGELLDEAEFLFRTGEYSEAELEETSLQYEQSKNSLFSAAAEHYNALRNLSIYISGIDSGDL